MPSPLFNFRLAPEAAASLREVAKFYNGGNASAFLRDMVTAMISGDPQKVAAFNKELFGKMGEQLTLDLLKQAPLPVPKVVSKKGGRRAKQRR